MRITNQTNYEEIIFYETSPMADAVAHTAIADDSGRTRRSRQASGGITWSKQRRNIEEQAFPREIRILHKTATRR